MSTSPCTSSTDAQKEARRRRFFAAISSSSQQQSQPQTKKQPQAESEKAQQAKSSSSASAAAGASVASNATAAPLSEASKAFLMRKYQEELKNPAPECDLPTDPESQAMVRAGMQALMSAEPSKLPPGLAMMQRKMMEMEGPMRELEQVPMESLPPELQKLKREDAERRASIPPQHQDPWGVVENQDRINKLLRDNGERELPFDELDDCLSSELPAKQLRAQQLCQAFAVSQTDLMTRKPQLAAVIARLLQEGMKKVPNIKVQFQPDP